MSDPFEVISAMSLRVEPGRCTGCQICRLACSFEQPAFFALLWPGSGWRSPETLSIQSCLKSSIVPWSAFSANLLRAPSRAQRMQCWSMRRVWFWC